jgi:hypothetical protein
MAKDNQINVRVNDRTNEAIEDFAEDKDYTKTEAVRRMVEGRLVGEGYMEGIAATDGGFIEEVEATQEAVQDTQERVDTLSAEIQEFRSGLSTLAPGLFVAFIWGIVATGFSLPLWLHISSGVLVIAYLLYLNYQVIYNV